jgi:hypothetical protein
MTNSVQERQTFFGEFGEEIIKVNCLHFVDNLFVYDLDLFSGGDMAEKLYTAMNRCLKTPVSILANWNCFLWPMAHFCANARTGSIAKSY